MIALRGRARCCREECLAKSEAVAPVKKSQVGKALALKKYFTVK